MDVKSAVTRAALLFLLLPLACGGRTDLWPWTDAASGRPDASVVPQPDLPPADLPSPDVTPDLATPPDLALPPDQPASKPWLTTASTPGFAAHVSATDVVTSSAGDALVTGYYMGKATFGSTLVDFKGGVDLFVARVGPTGAFSWVTVGAAKHDQRGKAVALDGAGNVVVAGEFQQTLTLGGKTFPSTSGTRDLFVAKLSPAGKVLWVRTFGGKDYDRTHSVAADAKGNVFLWATFRSSIAIGAKTYASSGDDDLLLVKLSPAGAPLWALTAGGSTFDEAGGVVADEAGGCVVTGDLSQASLGGKTIKGGFVARISADGKALWVRTPDSGSFSAHDVARGGGGSFYVSGHHSGKVSFGAHSLTGAGILSDLVIKLSPTSTPLWGAHVASFALYTSIYMHEPRLAVNASGEIAVSATFQGTLTSVGGTLISAGKNDIYAARLDAKGAVQWVTRLGGAMDDENGGVGLYQAGDVLVAGGFAEQASFGKQTLVAKGYKDLFLWRIGAGGP
jgi:hypothetical protein